jgi:hypothetical protein
MAVVVGSDKMEGGNPVKILDSRQEAHKGSSLPKAPRVVAGVFDTSSSSCVFPCFVAGFDDRSAGQLHYFRPKTQVSRWTKSWTKKNHPPLHSH